MIGRRVATRVVAGVVAAVLMAALVGCAQVEQLPAAQLFGSTGPRAVVGRTLAAIAAHDLDAANANVCGGGTIDELPIPISFRFGTAMLPGVSNAEALSVVDLDFSDLGAVETLQDESTATVEVRGPVGLTYDLPAVQELAVRATEGRDPATVATVMAVLGDGHLATTMHVTVTLANDTGRWLICPGSSIEG